MGFSSPGPVKEIKELTEVIKKANKTATWQNGIMIVLTVAILMLTAAMRA